MRSFGAIMLVACLAGLALAGGKHRVGGVATYTERFGRWGGAVPNRDQQLAWAKQNAEGAKPKPLVGQALLVRAGKTNRDVTPVVELTTGPDGRFALELAPGDYCVVDAARRHPTKPGTYVDAKCYAQTWATCDAVWHVTEASDQSVAITFERKHFGPPPCYHGPSPP